jgi:hypothetical protein
MPTETTKGTERCSLHPGSVSVAHCARCHRTLCMTCALPVRGVVLGMECLPEDVAAGADDATPPRRPPMSRWWLAVGIALAILLGSTVLPWTRFGTGSGWFGAWGLPLRWSSTVVLAGVFATLVWLWRRSPGRAAAATVAVVAVVASAGAELAILNPPPFTTSSVAPWIALAAGVVAGASAFTIARHPGV